MLCIGEEDTPISLEFERRGEKNSYETFKVTLRRTGQLLREVLNIKYLCICFNLFTPTLLSLCAIVAAMCMQAFCLVHRRLEVAAEQAAARMLNSRCCDGDPLTDGRGV